MTDEKDERAQAKLDEIRAMQKKVDQASITVADLKEELKDAKETLNIRIGDLGVCIKDRFLPLFAESDGAPSEPDESADEPSADEPADKPDDEKPADPSEAEREGESSPPKGVDDVPLDELDKLDTNRKAIAALSEAGIKTVGEYELAVGGDAKKLVAVKGIGPKSAESVIDMVETFYGEYAERQKREEYAASILDIAQEDIDSLGELGGKELRYFYSTVALSEAKKGTPATVKAFIFAGDLWTITSMAIESQEGKADTREFEAWKLMPIDKYGGKVRSSGGNRDEPWKTYEGRKVIFDGKPFVLTDEALITTEGPEAQVEKENVADGD